MGRRSKGSPLARRGATREYRKVFWVGTEGRTERDYFAGVPFRVDGAVVQFPAARSDKTNPRQVLTHFLKALKGRNVRKGDERWLVVDTDQWTQADFSELIRWQNDDSKNHLAISNPKFELFLVMHYGEADGCTTAAGVDRVLKKHIPGYSKRLSSEHFGADQVDAAIEQAERRRKRDPGLLPSPGNTDAYLLAKAVRGSRS